MDKSRELKLGAILSYVVIGLNMVIGIFYTPYLTRMLGQSEYGLYSLVASVISYLTILDLGFGNAIIVYTSKYLAKNDKENENKLHGMFFVIYVIIGIIVKHAIEFQIANPVLVTIDGRQTLLNRCEG